MNIAQEESGTDYGGAAVTDVVFLIRICSISKQQLHYISTATAKTSKLNMEGENLEQINLLTAKSQCKFNCMQ